jgi:hypothetical protein
MTETVQIEYCLFIMGSETSRLEWNLDEKEIIMFDADNRATFYYFTHADAAKDFIMRRSLWRGHLRDLAIRSTSPYWAEIKIHLPNCHMLRDLYLTGCDLAIAQELAEIVRDLTCLSTIDIRFDLITLAETEDLLSRFQYLSANIKYVWNAKLDCMCGEIGFKMLPQSTRLKCPEQE